MGAYQRNKRELLKAECLEYLNGKRCSRCGAEHWHISAYEFHHLGGQVKEANISKMLGDGTPWEVLKKELDKCIVLCSCCHKEVTAGLP